MAEPKFEIYKDIKGEYRFRLKAPNGEIIANGEGYTSKEHCLKGIESAGLQKGEGGMMIKYDVISHFIQFMT